jgi:hypothetical protein
MMEASLYIKCKNMKPRNVKPVIPEMEIPVKMEYSLFLS